MKQEKNYSGSIYLILKSLNFLFKKRHRTLYQTHTNRSDGVSCHFIFKSTKCTNTNIQERNKNNNKIILRWINDCRSRIRIRIRFRIGIFLSFFQDDFLYTECQLLCMQYANMLNMLAVSNVFFLFFFSFSIRFIGTRRCSLLLSFALKVHKSWTRVLRHSTAYTCFEYVRYGFSQDRKPFEWGKSHFVHAFMTVRLGNPKSRNIARKVAEITIRHAIQFVLLRKRFNPYDFHNEMICFVSGFVLFIVILKYYCGTA